MSGGKFCNPWVHPEGGGLPFYGEIGKKIRDVFGNYPVGLFGMNVTGIITDYGMKFSDQITSNQETGDVFGTIESKFASSQQNLIFGQKWTSKNDLSAEFFLVDFCQGAIAKLIGTVNTKNDKKMLLVGTDIRNDFFTINLGAEFKSKSPVVKATVATGYENISLGYSTSYISENSKFSTHDFKVSYNNPSFSLLGALENEFNVISASIQGRLIDDIDGALEVKHSQGGDDDGMVITLGVKYIANEDSVLRCKVNSKAVVGLSLVQKINDSTSVNLCTLLEGKDLINGKHKIGFGLSLSV